MPSCTFRDLVHTVTIAILGQCSCCFSTVIHFSFCFSFSTSLNFVLVQGRNLVLVLV